MFPVSSSTAMTMPASVRKAARVKLADLDAMIAEFRDENASESDRRAALDRIATATYRYAIHHALKWHTALGGLDEAVSAAGPAFMTAVRTYEPSRSTGGGFLYHLKRCVFTAIRDEVKRARRMGRSPQANGHGQVSMSGFEDLIPAADHADAIDENDIEVANRLLAHWRTLGGRYLRMAEIIESRYGLGGRKPATLLACARIHKITHERIRVIEQDALTLLHREIVRSRHPRALVA